MGIENKLITLRLNSGWTPIGFCTIKDAIIALNSSPEGKEDKAAIALDIGYDKKDDGEWDFSKPAYIIPTKWEDWLNLPIRDDLDFAIHTPRLTIRCPIVIISTNYSKIPTKNFRPTTQSIMERDNFTCQYTGKKLPRSKLNLDHILPKDKGGRDTFENLVTCDKEINFKKGNKLNEEAGLKLIRQPRAPLPMPVSALIREAKHPMWEPFLINK